VPPRDHQVVARPRSTRLLGWFVAANAAATLIAVLGARSPAADAAHQIALWCGLA
jgi:hypothetical protein